MRLIWLTLLGGCFFEPAPSSTASPSETGASGDGKLLIAWTVAGQSPSEKSCAGVDHLTLRLTMDDLTESEISPIPCTLSRLRYDNLPSGRGMVTLVAISPSQCELARGSSAIDLRPTLPDAPSPVVAIAALRHCP